MAVKYIAPGKKANTVELRAKFAQVNTWKVCDYNNEGFTVLSVEISASGPVKGASSTIVDRWVDRYSYIDKNGEKRFVVIPWKERKQVIMEEITLDEATVDPMTSMLVKEHRMIKFQIERVTILNRKTKDIILLRAAGRGKNRRLYVIAINNVSHENLDVEGIIMPSVHNLMERSCFITPSKFSPAIICTEDINTK